MALSTGSKIVVSDISNALAGKQNNLGFAPIQQGGGANQGNNKVYIGWDGGALRCQVDSTDLGQIVTTVSGQTTANYAHSAGQAYPMREGGVRMYMNWSGQSGQPSWLWGGEDGTNMYVYNPSNFSVNYANSAGWANSANATALSQVAVGYKDTDGGTKAYGGGRVDNTYYVLPSGGTWRWVASVLNDWHTCGENSGGSRVYCGSSYAIVAIRVG